MIMRDITNVDLCVVILARMAEQTGTKALTCKLTHEEVCELLSRYDVAVTKTPGEPIARSYEFASNDEYTIVFKEKTAK